MTRWEYCVVTGIGTRANIGTYMPYLIRFTRSGYDRTHLKKTRHAGEREVVARTIAELGADGWELVGAVHVGESSQTYSLWFERPTADVVE